MERAENHLKRKSVWQVLTCPRREPITSPSRIIGFEKRRLSIRSENVTIGAAATTTTQSPSFLTQQQPGKENELPYEPKVHNARKVPATVVGTVTRRKQSWNPVTRVTDPAKKVIKRRLSGDYEDQLSLNKSRRVNPDDQTVLPRQGQRVKEPAPDADASHRQHITPRFPIYDDRNDTDTDPRVREIIEDENVRDKVKDKARPLSDAETLATLDETFKDRENCFKSGSGSGSGSGAVGRDSSGREATRYPEFPIWERFRTDLYPVWKSYEIYYSQSKLAEEKVRIDESTTPQESRAKGAAAEFLDSRSSDNREICSTEFRIERIDGSDDRTPAMINRRKVKSGSAIGRLNVPLRRGNDISPFKKRMLKLIKSIKVDEKTAAVVGGEYVCNSNSKIGLGCMDEVRKLSTPKIPCPDDAKERENRSAAKSTIDPSTGAMKKTSRFTIPEALKGPKSISICERVTLRENDDQTAKRSFGEYRISISDFHKTSVSFVRQETAPLAKPSLSSSVEKIQQQPTNYATAELTPTNETNRIVKTDKLIPSYCQPSLRDESSKLKNHFIEFFYDGVVADSHVESRSSTEDVSALGICSDESMIDWKRINRFEPLLSTVRPRNDDTLHIPAEDPAATITAGTEFIRSEECTQARMVAQKQPDAKTIGDGSRKITRDRVNIVGDRGQTKLASHTRISEETTAGPNAKINPGGAADRFPVSAAEKQVQPRILNKLVFADRESRAKSAVNVSEPFHETPLEIEYATDYTEESIDVEHARQESCHKVSQLFLKGRIVTPEQRKIVVNFLISVHDYLSTSSSTLYQAIRMFDAILDLKDVSVKELQLVALGTTWIAIKNMESKVPNATEMISFAKDMYNAEGSRLLCKCERQILKTLGFSMRFPDPCYQSVYYIQQLWSSLGPVANEPSIRKITYHYASYLMDVALLDKNYSITPSGLLAAAATQTAARLVLQGRSREYLAKHSPWNNEKTIRYSYTQEDIERVAGSLIEGVLDSAVKDSSTGAVYKKYKNSKYDRTSYHLVTVIKIMKLSEPASTKQN